MILCIDDNMVMAQALRKAATGAGLDAVSFTTTQEAESYVEHNDVNIDLFVVDYHLRGIAGLEFVEKLKAKHPDMASVPVIVLSSDNSLDRSQFGSLNVKDYVLKPFSMKALGAKMKAAIAAA